MEEYDEIPELHRITLRPGDVLVCECRSRLSAQETDELMDVLQSVCPDNRVLVLDDGIRLKVLSIEQEEEQDGDIPDTQDAEGSAVLPPGVSDIA